MEYRLERDDRGPLVFEGEQLSFVSTQQRGKQRWTELGIYRVTAEESPMKWAVEIVGMSTLEGERDYHRVEMCATPEDVSSALTHKGRLSGPGLDCLEYASEKDDELDSFLDKLFQDEVIK